MDSNENTNDTQLDEGSQVSDPKQPNGEMAENEGQDNSSVSEDTKPGDEDLPPLDEKLIKDISALIRKRGAIDSTHPRLNLVFNVELSPEQKHALDKFGGIAGYLVHRHGDRFFTFNNKLYTKEFLFKQQGFSPKSVSTESNGEFDSEKNCSQAASETDCFLVETYNQDNFQDLSQDFLDTASEISQKTCFEGSPCDCLTPPIGLPPPPSPRPSIDATQILSPQIQLMVIEVDNLKKSHSMALQERDNEIARLKEELERLKIEKSEQTSTTQAKAKLKVSIPENEIKIQQDFVRYEKEFTELRKEFETYLQRFREDDPVTLKQAIERYRKFENYIIISKRKEYLKELRNYKHALEEAGKVLQEETNRFFGNKAVSKKLENIEMIYDEFCDQLIEEKKRHDECWSRIEEDMKKQGYLDVDKFIELDLPPLPTLYPFYQEIMDQIPEAFRVSLSILQILAPLYLRGELLVPLD